MQEKILGFIVAFGHGHSVRFPTRTAADAMVRFLTRRGLEVAVYAHLARSGDGETILLPIHNAPSPVPAA